MNNLSKLRKNIDACDRQIVDVLAKRFFLVKKIAQYKKENKLKPLDSARWQKVVDKVATLSAKKKAPAALVKSIFDSIHQESLAIEENIISKSEQGLPSPNPSKNMHKLKKGAKNISQNFDTPPLVFNADDKIAFLGPLGTYSHLATEKIFDHGVLFTKNNLISKNNIIDIFDSVQKGETLYGVVPAENSTEGIVKDTIHLFASYDVSIIKEYSLFIDHSLMTSSPVKNILQIKKVKAHPQALGQCRKWLKENTPNALLEPTDSNVSGISDLKINEAIIASKSIASMYDLSIAAKNISDNPDNATMFYVIKRNDKEYPNDNRQFIEGKKYIFLLEVIDRPGVLRDILDVMVRYDFNLSRIISIPEGMIGRYSFVVDIAKTRTTTPIAYKELCEKLYKYCSSVKLLGIV